MGPGFWQPQPPDNHKKNQLWCANIEAQTKGVCSSFPKDRVRVLRDPGDSLWAEGYILGQSRSELRERRRVWMTHMVTYLRVLVAVEALPDLVLINITEGHHLGVNMDQQVRW